MPPSWGAGALLHPGRRVTSERPSLPHEDLTLDGDGIPLRTWRFRTPEPRRGTVIYLHGVGDSRGSSVGLARHLTGRGFDVLAHDSRAHGQSGGEACTYGFHEKRDLHRVIDSIAGLKESPVVLIGHSMGAAVALQAAAEDPRIAGVVAVATFSDLRTVAFERAPFFASRGNIERALQLAEQEGKFRIDQVSPVAAATRIRCPVFLLHGAQDDETPPAHSQRVFQALATPDRRLLLVPAARHGNALNAQSWREIDAWLDAHFGAPAAATVRAR
jgi:alpha-beta hydrolase superfamily lysophospholipase